MTWRLHPLLAPGQRPAGPINAFEAWTLLGVSALGISILTGVGDSASLDSSLSPMLVCAWSALYACGGAIAFAGLVWREPWTGVEVKRVGLVALFFGGLIYSLAAFGLGTRGVPTGLLHLFLAAAALSRIIQVTRKLSAARRILGGTDESGA